MLVCARLCKYQKRVHSTRSASDKVYQLLARGGWFSPGTPTSPITKTGRHDIAEILLKMSVNTKNQSIQLAVKLYDLPPKNKIFTPNDQ